MKPRIFRTLVLLATFSLIGIVVLQVYWVNSTLKIQENQEILLRKEYSQQEKIFNDRVTIALTNVAEQIMDYYDDHSDLYNAVEQKQSNYFIVRMNDTLHPYLLERMLRMEFDQNNIKEDFEYGIYDCFSDSLRYGKYIDMDASNSNDVSQRPQLKMANDGHYFSVFFPNRVGFTPHQVDEPLGAWFYTSIIILIVTGFFGYSLYVIMHQKRLADVKNDFINNMTHELKTPISTISISSEVLLKDGICNDPQRVNQYARIIYNENKRLENQVERVLQIATLDKEEISLKKTNIHIHDLLESCVSNFRVPIEANGGSLSLELNAATDEIEADKVHLTNIFYNLLDNARKYSEGPAELIVRTESDANGVRIKIIDHGIGIAKDALKNIFEKFYRVPTGNVHNVKGFGLGLYYVKVMTEQHGGTISVKSHPGKGSEFELYFPFH